MPACIIAKTRHGIHKTIAKGAGFVFDGDIGIVESPIYTITEYPSVTNTTDMPPPHVVKDARNKLMFNSMKTFKT